MAKSNVHKLLVPYPDKKPFHWTRLPSSVNHNDKWIYVLSTYNFLTYSCGGPYLSSDNYPVAMDLLIRHYKLFRHYGVSNIAGVQVFVDKSKWHPF